MKHIYILSFFQFSFPLTQLLPNELVELNDNSPIVNKLENVANVDSRSKKSLFSLGPAPRFEHGSPSDIDKYFINSIISGCGVLPMDTLTCMCPSIYEKTSIVENDKERSFAIVTINKKLRQIVVSYRATMVGRNWLNNFDFPLVNADFIKGVKVHRGFLRHYQTLRPGTQAAVIKLLDQPNYSNYTLHVTGYSLGAAISTISAIDWVNLLHKRNDNRKVEIYAYAGPRVGDKAFVDSLGSLNIPITRFTSSNDIVPHLPPRAFGFLHAGTELYYDPNISKIRVCRQNSYEDPNCNQKHVVLSFKKHLTPFDQPASPLPTCQ